MGVIIKIKKPSLMSVLLLIVIVFTVMVFPGCGKPNSPPPGATMTLEALPLITVGTGTTGSNLQVVRVSVFGPDGIPLDKVDVDLIAPFTIGDSILFSGATATAPYTFFASVTTGTLGFYDVQISAPTALQKFLADVAGLGAIPAATGGNLINGMTYSYKVTAIDTVGGETDAPNTISALVSTPSCTVTNCGNVKVSWSPVTGAAGYKVYSDGGLGGPFGFLTSLGAAMLSYTDTGSPAPVFTQNPPTSNGAGVSINIVAGKITGTSGVLVSTLDVAF